MKAHNDFHWSLGIELAIRSKRYGNRLLRSDKNVVFATGQLRERSHLRAHTVVQRVVIGRCRISVLHEPTKWYCNARRFTFAPRYIG